MKIIVKPKKILFMLRLYSGFVNSIRTGIWEPSGTPAIFKLLESIRQENIETEFYFYCPPEFETDIAACGNTIKLEGFPGKIQILRRPVVFKCIPPRLTDFLLQIYWATLSLKIAWGQRCDLFYTDRGNIIGGAFVARFSHIKTIIRMLGMPTEMASLLTSSRPTSKLLRWAYGSQFDAIIGTRDGSSIIPFVTKALDKNVPYHVKANGVNDSLKQPSTDLNNPICIGFIGRLSRGKGANKLIDAAQNIAHENFEIRIAGYGPDMESLQQQIKSEGLAGKVKLLGRLSHEDLLREISSWDMYVSLNEYGQISNANLEACKAGLCLLFINTEDADDEDSKSFYGENMIQWVGRENLSENLAKKISQMIENPSDIIKAKKSTQDFAKNLNGWPDRISWEIDALLKIAGDRA